MATLAQLANRALDCQDACNLSGVLFSFQDDARELRKILGASDEGFSTDAFNRHPIMAMYASKVGDLTGIGGGEQGAFSEAYRACKVIAGR